MPANNSTLTTNFNVSPYYDDFADAKNFYRILWKPGYAVQARELTQAQTILQKQIDRFGKHVFREGSIVLPGQFTIENNVDYIKIKDVDGANNTVDVNEYKGEKLLGLTTGINAYVIEVADGVETSSNTKTLYVRYDSAGNANSSIVTFQNNEVLYAANVGQVTVLSANSSGKGSRFLIDAGVFFAKEHFISFEQQSVILNRYSTNPTCRVGFYVTEDIIDYTDDISLLDPALEASNYAAPGADRLRLTPTLMTLDIADDTGPPNFVELFTIDNGVITELHERPEYNILRDELAKRTFDESGDYYVKGLNVRIRENLDTGTNGGYSNTGNSQLLSVGVEPGIGYVKGYEVNKLVTDYITIEKSLNYENVSDQAATAGYGSYIICDEYTGYIGHDTGAYVGLYNTANNRLSDKGWVGAEQAGALIGTANVNCVEYYAGTLGTPNAQISVYLTDIRMVGSNTFSNVKSIYTTGFGADVVLDTSNNAVLKETDQATLLYYVGPTATRTIRDTAGSPDMSFNFKRSTTGISILSGGTFDLTVATSNEQFPYGTGTLTAADKRDITLSIDVATNIAMSGTVSGTGGTPTLSGSSTNFDRLNVGDKIEIAGKSNTFFIAAIGGPTTITLTENLPSGITGNSYFKAYKAGDIIDLTGIGADAGATRSVTATPTQLSFDLKETFGASKAASIVYQLNRYDAKEITKNLRDHRYVKINVDSHSATTNGPYSLGLPDLYKVRKIVSKTGSFPTSNTDGSDVTSSFIIDNGQKDMYYDFATIDPKTALSANTYLLVELDHFQASYTLGRGYFSVDSYPVDDTIVSDTTIRTENIPIFTSPITKNSYDLRNYIDYRPYKTATANSSTGTGATATVNPAAAGAFDYEANGLRLPVPSSQYNYSYSYYLARRDVIAMNREGIITAITGVPRAYPVTPSVPEDEMSLASIYVAPYPSLATNYGTQINRQDLACRATKLSNIRFTMRDIGVLKNRIVNLEYYASLNLLQKAAVDLSVLDENGLNRFKNGIFVDTFADHSFGDIKNPDYRIVVDPQEKSIRPIYTMHSFKYDYLSGSNVVKTGDLITLPYTHTTLIAQPRVTSYRNIELSSYRFIGNIELDPPLDVWTDTDQLEDENIFVGDANTIPQGTITTWNEWQTKIVGYVVDPSSTGNGRGKTFIDPRLLAGYTTPNIPANLISSPNSPRDQRVSLVEDTTRTGTQTSYSAIENTQRFGNKVIDVSLVPYIRPQVIQVLAQGLKASTKVYVFFDGENMSEYVTPLTVWYDDDGIPHAYEDPDDPFEWMNNFANEGTQLLTDVDGFVRFGLRLPTSGKQFTVGTKELVVSDSPTNSIADASTYAKGYFTSHGLIQQKQDTVLTTRQIISDSTEITETKRKTTPVGYVDNPSCAAYSFIPRGPEGEEGVFLTKVDLYFAAKHPTLGVWVEIRAMDNAGGITRTQIPFSEVWKNSADIDTSTDASLATTFTFPSPVFLYNDTQYAFVIHTVGLNPDTYFYISRLGETDLNTGAKVNARPLTGTFYTTNNNLNWDIVPDVDLYCTFYRAAFTTGVTGQAIIGNEPVERLEVNNVSSVMENYGDKFVGNFRMTLSGNTGSIIVTDILIGANSGANSGVIAIDGSVFTVPNTQYVTGETCAVYFANMTSKAITTTITNITSAGGKLQRYQVYRDNASVEIVSSNGKFYTGDTITARGAGFTGNVAALSEYRYSVVDFEPTYLNFRKTTLGFEMKSFSNTGTAGAYTSIVDNNNYYFDDERALFGRSEEVTDHSGSQTNNVRISMASTTEYLSPVVDIRRTHSIYVDNIINNDATGEASTSGGALWNKYICSPVVLAEGQDAEDIIIMLTAYRPPTSDIKVWVKIIHNEDSDALAQASWIELEKLKADSYSSLTDRNDFKEFSYVFPDAQKTGPNGEVQYTNTHGITFTGYKYYAVKIGLMGTNSALVPRVADLRCINLQM